MNRHRFSELVSSVSEKASDVPALSVSGFVVCPLMTAQPMTTQLMLWQQVYQAAWEQARAVSLPSRLERLQAVSCN
jgi:hypothetical protein